MNQDSSTLLSIFCTTLLVRSLVKMERLDDTLSLVWPTTVNFIVPSLSYVIWADLHFGRRDERRVKKQIPLIKWRRLKRAVTDWSTST